MSAVENLSWLADLPEGWAGLYERLIADLGQIDPTLRVIEAKEKFASLRVYLAEGSPEAFERIDAASREAASTCQSCGARGRLYNSDGYYQTLCQVHAPATAILQEDGPPTVSFRIAGGKIERIDR